MATEIEVRVDNSSHGKAAGVVIYHKSESSNKVRQVAVIYSSGYLRLKQNAEASLPNPFGGSFVLGPAYNGSTENSTNYSYYNNPTLHLLEINTSKLRNNSVIMRAYGRNQEFDVVYDMLLLPSDPETKVHVTQNYTARANITIDSAARTRHEGFRLVQYSTMFIPMGRECDIGNSDCHDSDAARYNDTSMKTRQVEFKDLMPDSVIFEDPLPLADRWLDLLHMDNESWQRNIERTGNTPNLRILLDELPEDRTLTPQGWINDTVNHTHDNVGLWIHDDGDASLSWRAGEHGEVSYWLIARDDPPRLDEEA